MDIYARVGGNKPLIVSDLRTSVDVKDLTIRFEGLMGRPIVCGISVRKDLPSSELTKHFTSVGSFVQIL